MNFTSNQHALGVNRLLRLSLPGIHHFTPKTPHLLLEWKGLQAPPQLVSSSTCGGMSGGSNTSSANLEMVHSYACIVGEYVIITIVQEHVIPFYYPLFPPYYFIAQVNNCARLIMRMKVGECWPELQKP